MSANTLRYAATLAIAIATLAACAGDPIAPGNAVHARASSLSTSASANTSSREEATVPFTFVQYASCANGGQGEVLWASGVLQYRGHWITTAQGQRYHYAVVAGFTGTAIGEESGEVYDIATRELAQGNVDYGTDGIRDSGEELQRVALRLTNRQTGVSFTILLVGRFVQTPTGEFVLDGWEGTARCS